MRLGAVFGNSTKFSPQKRKVNSSVSKDLFGNVLASRSAWNFLEKKQIWFVSMAHKMAHSDFWHTHSKSPIGVPSRISSFFIDVFGVAAGDIVLRCLYGCQGNKIRCMRWCYSLGAAVTKKISGDQYGPFGLRLC